MIHRETKCGWERIFARSFFRANKEWATLIQNNARLENTLQKEAFFQKTNQHIPPFLFTPLIAAFFFFSKIVLQNIIIQSFQGILPIFTLPCFERPHYTSDLATSHCGQIFQNIPF